MDNSAARSRLDVADAEQDREDRHQCGDDEGGIGEWRGAGAGEAGAGDGAEARRDRLELERSKLITGLKEELDDAEEVARKKFYELVFQKHPGGRPSFGTLETVPRLTHEDLVRFHTRHYRPERATLVAVGDFKAEDMAAKLTEVFSAWEKGGTASAPLPEIQRQQQLPRPAPSAGQGPQGTTGAQTQGAPR